MEENQIKQVESTEGTFERTGASVASYYCVQLYQPTCIKQKTVYSFIKSFAEIHNLIGLTT